MDTPTRSHPDCKAHGCRSTAHLVCPKECELLTPVEGVVLPLDFYHPLPVEATA